MLLSKNAKFALPPTRNLNASQWNICCVGSQTQNDRVGHVHFIFLGVDFICVGALFSGEYVLNATTLWSEPKVVVR